MTDASRRRFRRSTFCIALALSGGAWAQGAAPEFARRAPDVLRAEGGRALADARSGGQLSAVANLLRQRGRDDTTLAALRAGESSTGRAGMTHLRIEQAVDGLPVYGAYAKAAFDRNGALVHLIDHLAPVPAAALAAPATDAAQALNIALQRVHPGVSASFNAAGNRGAAQLFDGGAFFHGQPSVTAVAVPLGNGSMARGWLVETWTQKSNQLNHTLVSGVGRVLNVENRTANDSYRVFAIDPLKTTQTVVNGPGTTGNAQSPAGWLAGAQTSFAISGNNVKTYLDSDANNAADAGGALRSVDFLTVSDFGVSPTTSTNKEVAVQNLFYLNNRIHDILYSHGFTEMAGNFQTSNFSNGGAQNDAVNAEAQDGSGTDNANFATPADGSAPRMQMYLWTGAGATHEVAISSGPTYAAMGASFGPSTAATGSIVASSPADGCRRISGAVSGKIALIDRGTCDFVVKVKNAQSAGAIGVIVTNNDLTKPDEIFTMGGTGTVAIPSVMISKNNADNLRARGASSGTLRKKAVQPQQLDASLDTDIVYHEYCHGLTWRMIGGMSGPLAGAIGEGMGDGCALLINADGPLPDVVGEYSAGNTTGIRRYPYAGYPLKYGNVTGAEVHDDGEVYAAIVWRMIELFGAGGRERLFGHIVDGMNYTPATPKFENMRDGILQSVAVSATPADCSLVWQAFAQFGVGVGAKATIKGTRVTITQSTTAPGTCN